MDDSKPDNVLRGIRFKHHTCMWGLGDLKQDSAGLQVSDLKAYKVDVIDIVLGFTEVPCNDDRYLQATVVNMHTFKHKPAAVTGTKTTCKTPFLT